MLLDSDRFLLDLHSPSHDVRLHFPDEFILLACRRALTAMLNDARRLHPEAIAGRLYRLTSNAYHRWNLSGHLGAFLPPDTLSALHSREGRSQFSFNDTVHDRIEENYRARAQLGSESLESSVFGEGHLP